MSSPKYLVDLFSCVGGFSYGAKVANLPCLIAIDCDKDSLVIHQLTHPDCRHILLELGQQTPEEFVKQLKQLLSELNVDPKDMHFHGSPPCTNYCTSHPKQNTSKSDPISGLLDWTLEVIHLLKPSFWSIENVSGAINALRDRHKYIFEEENNFSVYTSVTGHDFDLSIRRQRVIIGKGFTIPESIDFFELNKNTQGKRRKTRHIRRIKTPVYHFLPGVVEEFKDRFNCSIAEIAIKSPNNNIINPLTGKTEPINNAIGEGIDQLTGGISTPCSKVLSVIYYFSKTQLKWVRDRSLTGPEIASILGFPKDYCDKIPERHSTRTSSTLYVGFSNEQFTHTAKFTRTSLRQFYGNIVIPQIATSIIKNGILKLQHTDNT